MTVLLVRFAQDTCLSSSDANVVTIPGSLPILYTQGSILSRRETLKSWLRGTHRNAQEKARLYKALLQDCHKVTTNTMILFYGGSQKSGTNSG